MDRAFAAMSEFGILAKLIRLCRMTLSNNSYSSVKVGMNLFEPFDTVRGFKQGGPAAFSVIAAKMGLAVNEGI